jgi:flavin-dependent thymidylate synthase
MASKDLNVKLVSWTNRPIEVIMWAFMNMHWDIPSSLDKFVKEQIDRLGGEDEWEETKIEFIKLMAENPHSSVLEFVNTVWMIDGASRSFQQQLTRTRTAAYSIQSLRIYDVGKFSDKEMYHIPESIKRDTLALAKYKNAMLFSQQVYDELSHMNGIKTEDARGVLPLNIISPITMSIDLRALQHMLEMRLCYLTQGEYRQVADKMIEEIMNKMGEEFGHLFRRPCQDRHECPMPIHCGKMPYPQKKEYKNIRIEKWLKG